MNSEKNLKKLILKIIYFSIFEKDNNENDVDLIDICLKIINKINSKKLDIKTQKLFDNFLKYKELFLKIKNEKLILDDFEETNKKYILN